MARQWTGLSTGFLALAMGLFLAGCGGSAAVQSVPFEGPVVDADYIGKSFPVYFLVGEDGDPKGRATAAKGTITYTDADTITLTLPGSSPIFLDRTGTSATGSTYTGTLRDASTITVVVSDFASTDAFRLASSTAPDYTILGGFGFETLPADRPATGTYDLAGAVFLTSDFVEDFLPIAGDGTLSADFGAGSISGTLLSSDVAEIRLAGDQATPDELALQIGLDDGQITPSGFSGALTVAGQLNIDGGPPTELGISVSNDSAEGAFFGENAAAVAGIFEGDLSLSDDGTPLIDVEAAGFFSGARTGP